MTGRGSRAAPRRWLAGPTSRWWKWVAAWTGLGLAIRVGSVLGRLNRKPGGDASYYHSAANLLAAGKGFINPIDYSAHHMVVPTASFPPGFVFVLTVASLAGLKSFLAQRIWCCIIGAVAIPVSALVGREVSDRGAADRVGLIAAFLVAVYPNIWMSDEIGMSETLSPLLVALVLLASYRFWRRPGWRTGAWLGASIGVAALARDELTLLGLFIVVPLALTARATWRQRIGWLATAAAVAVVIVGPWVGYNMSRFKDPVYISSGLGITLASANCGYTYHGEFEGYWDFECANTTPINPNVDESVQGAEAQHYAVQYIKSHFGHFIPVEFARFGRAFGLYHPMGQIRFDSVIETRPYHWALLGLFMYYGLLAGSAGGIVVMRRRKVPVYPMLAVGATVVISTLLTFGNTRYRSTFEVSLVLMTAVALGLAWDRAGPRLPADETEKAAEDDRDLDRPRLGGGEPSMVGPLPSS